MKKLFLLLALALAGMLTAGNTPPVAQATPLLDLATPDLILRAVSSAFATSPCSPRARSSSAAALASARCAAFRGAVFSRRWATATSSSA